MSNDADYLQELPTLIRKQTNFHNFQPRIQTPEVGTGQPQRFLPVFEMKEDAEEFAGDEQDLLVKVEVRQEEPAGGQTDGGE